MRKNRNNKAGKIVLSLVICLTMILSSMGSAFAAGPGAVIKAEWENFRGNNEHNAVTSTPVANKAEDIMLYWATKAGSGYGGSAIGSPILVDGYLYFNQGKTINMMDAMSGEIVKTGDMVGNSNFSIIPPTYGEGKIFVGLSDGRIQAFDAKTLKSLWVYADPLKGQPNCPITYYDGYVYTGFWNSENKDANFACVSAKDENPNKSQESKKAAWTFTSQGGFYWAGAYVCKNFVLVGTDDGEPGYTSKTSKIMCFDPETGKVLSKLTGLNCDLRSNISYDRETNRYYCTTKGGSFYSFKVSSKGKISGLKELDLGGMSTSTPAIYNGRAYVGVSGVGQFSKYNGHNITVIDLKKWEIAYTADCMGYPQTSGLICTNYEDEDGYVYVYFFENMTPGKIRYIKDKPGQTELLDGVEETFKVKGQDVVYNCAPVLFTPQGKQAQYAICSPIVDEYGTIYFKNDSAHMMALGSPVTKITIDKLPTQTTYDIGDTFNPAGIKVTAYLKNGMKKDISEYIKFSDELFIGGETDVNIFYDYQMYNDATKGDLLYQTVDIKVNDAATSAKNNALKEKIKNSKTAVTLKADTKKAAVSWKKVEDASGYQIMRSLKKSSGFKTVKTITKGSTVKYTDYSLKTGTTYYYKVRPFRKINGTKYYGSWSAVKYVKAK